MLVVIFMGCSPQILFASQTTKPIIIEEGRDNQRPNPVLATPSRDRKFLGQVCWQIVGRQSVILIDCHHASVSHGFTTFATL